MALIRTGLLGLAAAVMLAAAPAAGGPAATGDVVLYTSVPQEIATAFPAGFMRRYPQVKVQVLRAGGTEVERRLFAEIETGGIRADLVWLADPPVFLRLRQLGQLQSYRSPEARHLPGALRDPGGFFTVTRVSNVVIVVNTTLIPAHAAPKHWADFPRYGRTAAMPNPVFSGTFDVVVAAIVQQYGWGWFERARREGLLVLRSNSDVARALTSREIGVGMMLDSVTYRLIQDGAPLAIVWPEDGAVSIPGPLAITTSARNVIGARLFVDYVLSKEGQQAMAAEGLIPVRSDVDPPRGLPRVDEIKSIPVPYEWMAQNLASLRARFDEIMLR